MVVLILKTWQLKLMEFFLMICLGKVAHIATIVELVVLFSLGDFNWNWEH